MLVPEPENVNKTLWAPLPKGVEKTKPHYGYDYIFDHPAFTGTTKKMSYIVDDRYILP